MPDKLPSNIQQQVKRGISILKQGGIVAFPTDTVYGLGASVNLPQAVERIYQVKKRPLNMALPLLLSNISQIAKVAYSIPQIAWTLARNFLPGALTLVLLKNEAVPNIVTAGGITVAVRIPAHPISIALIDGTETPVVGTSANLSGKPNSLTASEVRSQFDDKIDLIIDGGQCPGGRESTIIDVTGETPVILREGAISKAQLKQVCKNIILEKEPS